ncbi:MAG TPA: alpha/beta fold hydrolase [Candidatus Saccharimonadales bacterium]
MRLRLVSLKSTDNIELPGLLYTPERGTKKIAVWLHGIGDNAVFYKPEAINTLANALTEKGIGLLAFNNRGAHGSKRLKIADEALPKEDRRYQGGMYYELIADCVKDIDGAVSFLKQEGFSAFYLAGLSTGANKICAYHVRAKQNPFSKYVLAGPGDDIGLLFSQLGAKKFWAALQYAAKYAKTEPQRIMPKYSGMYPFSARSTWDMLNPDGDYNTFPFYECTTERLGKKRLFDEYQKIDLPTLVIFGENDEFTVAAGGSSQAIDLFMKYTSNAMLKKIDFNSVPGADHSFHGAEAAFATQVTDWLAYE